MPALASAEVTVRTNTSRRHGLGKHRRLEGRSGPSSRQHFLCLWWLGPRPYAKTGGTHGVCDSLRGLSQVADDRHFPIAIRSLDPNWDANYSE